MRWVSLPGLKRPGRGDEERVELYFHLRAFMACSRVNLNLPFFKDPRFMQVNSTASTGHCSGLRLLIPRCCQLMHFYRQIIRKIIHLYKDGKARGEINILFNEAVNCKTYTVVVVNECYMSIQHWKNDRVTPMFSEEKTCPTLSTTNSTWIEP